MAHSYMKITNLILDVQLMAQMLMDISAIIVEPTFTFAITDIVCRF